MLITEKCLIFNNLSSSCLFLQRNGTTGSNSITTFSQKGDQISGNSTTQKQFFPIRVPNPILPRAAVALLGLGFIDAGYSGDWSRIGVISEETESLLKLAAFVVVPVCVFMIFSFSRELSEEEEEEEA